MFLKEKFFNSWNGDPSIAMKTIISPLMAFIALIFLSITVTHASVLLTPEAMISAPRRGAAIPNPDGTLALYTLSEYSFETHKNLRGLYVLNISDASSWIFSNQSGISNPVWLGDGNKFTWLASQDDGSTSFQIGDATKPNET